MFLKIPKQIFKDNFDVWKVRELKESSNPLHLNLTSEDCGKITFLKLNSRITDTLFYRKQIKSIKRIIVEFVNSIFISNSLIQCENMKFPDWQK